MNISVSAEYIISKSQIGMCVNCKHFCHVASECTLKKRKTARMSFCLNHRSLTDDKMYQCDTCGTVHELLCRAALCCQDVTEGEMIEIWVGTERYFTIAGDFVPLKTDKGRADNDQNYKIGQG